MQQTTATLILDLYKKFYIQSLENSGFTGSEAIKWYDFGLISVNELLSAY